MKKVFADLALRAPYEAEILIPNSPKRVYVLLHGFKQTGRFIFEKIRPLLPDDVAIIAPNGPFFIPVEKNHGYSMRYSWYFFDSIQKKYLVDYGPAADYIKSILDQMNLIKERITIIGYSQGGYLAPKIAETIPSVDVVIGLACVFRNQYFNIRSSTTFHQINSSTDAIIDIAQANSEFNELGRRGNLGHFIELNGPDHLLGRDYLAELAHLL